jgi:dethiobiotin synthetase
MKSVFITGCDTDIGKTFVSIGLCLLNEYNGKSTGYYKPFQSGAYEKDGILVAPDLYELKKYTSIPSKYSYLFKGEVSPHLASILDGVEVDINKIKDDFINFSSKFDFTVIEGAGGLYCPAVKGFLFSDIIKLLNQEIIIVTTPNLGRLNHTLMTIECAKLNNIKIKGLIINKVPKEPTLSEKNFIKELKMFSNIDIIGEIPKLVNPNKEDIINAFKNINL